MSAVENLRALAMGLEPVPPGVEVFLARDKDAHGEGGHWRPGFYLAGFNQFVAVIVPKDGDVCPVRLAPIWSDGDTCLGAAAKLARLAAEA